MWLGNNITGSNTSHPAKHSLKGQCYEIFCLSIFHKSSSNRPQIIPFSAASFYTLAALTYPAVLDNSDQSCKFSKKF